MSSTRTAKTPSLSARKTAKAVSAKKSARPLANAAAKRKSAQKPWKKTAQKPRKHIAESATVLSSKVVYKGSQFRVLHDKLIEPGGRTNERDVIRHNGSAVILALDNSKSKRDPWVVMERQYRHAAGQFLWELPAGKIEVGEDVLDGAKRELAEETGYRARKWRPLVEYYASPGFLGESMKIFLAEGLEPGQTSPDEDEQIELRLVKLSELLKKIEEGAILDGKTISAVLLYARLLGKRRK